MKWTRPSDEATRSAPRPHSSAASKTLSAGQRSTTDAGIRWFALLWLCVASSKLHAVEVSAPAIDFDRDIRPIFSENCFACHGPDEAKRKAGFRLDRREDAFKPAKSGDLPIVPGDITKSALISRVTSTDDDERMPPVSTGKKLNAHQIELLRRWIAGGAVWKSHWAFVPPVRPALPEVRDAAWPRNDLDRFVLAPLEREKIKPSPEADKASLIRRASLDATGLPPTVEEVDAFLADGSSDAYEKVVDRLLSSPRYGEHMARYWLDAVRYADTHGYHIDSRRDMWKYRDWVIGAFNQNKPFDQFTTEQLAGDLLPNPTIDQKIATGYIRANMTTGEGGVIEDEYRAKYTFDRVETTSAIYLGMTLVCARCHSHKYDPIQHSEYYGLYAFFNQVADPVMDENKPNPEPFLKVPSQQQSDRLAWLKEHIDQGQRQMQNANPELEREQASWQRDWNLRLASDWADLEPSLAKSTATNGASLDVDEDRVVSADGPNPDHDVYELTFPLDPGPLSALRLEAIPDSSLPLEGSGRAVDGRFSLSEFEAELIGDPKDEKKSKPRRLHFARAVADAESAGHGIAFAIDGQSETAWQVPTNSITETHMAIFVLREPLNVERGSVLKVRLRHESSDLKAALGSFRISSARGQELAQMLHPPGFSPWHVLGPLKSGEPEAAFETVFAPEKEIDFKKKYPGVREEASWTERSDLEDGRANLLVQDLHGIHGVRYLYRTITVPKARSLELDVRADGLFRLWINGEMVGQRNHEELPGEGAMGITAQLKEGENKILMKIVTVQGASYFTFNPDLGSKDGLTGEIAAILAVSSKGMEASMAKVTNYFRRQHSAEYRKADNNVNHWRQESEVLDRSIPTTMIAKESAKPGDTFILLRGDYDKKGEKVLPHVPAIFPPLPKGAPTNRLGLAKWLVDPAHPLTARVTVNRFWQQYFGIGLVKTAEDFGVQGEHPANQDLLDWLATEFISSGWDVKHISRLILTSATYRQTSRATKEEIANDPENRLLARGPRFRMDAEMVRDEALFLGGLLVEKETGQSVHPYEPPGLWEAVSFNNSQKYVQDSGAAEYRRSLYTFWKRQSPPPSMLIFDAPTRESCTVRRSRSNTPLQALVLLNDPQFVEASRAFAQRIMLHGGDNVESRASFAFRMATARQPNSGELSVLLRIYQEQLLEFQRDSHAAEQLLAVGSFKPNPHLDRAELAAWATVASLIFNLDETVTKG